MSTRAAPGELERVRDFVNTLDVESGADAALEPGGTARVAARPRPVARAERRPRGPRRGAPPPRGDSRAPARNNGLSVRKEAALTLNRAAARAGVSLRFDSGGRVRLEPAARGIDSALGTAGRGRGLGHGRRNVDAPEGLPRGRLPLGVLRPRPKSLAALVLDGRVRQPDEGPYVPAAPRALTTRRRAAVVDVRRGDPRYRRRRHVHGRRAARPAAELRTAKVPTVRAQEDSVVEAAARGRRRRRRARALHARHDGRDERAARAQGREDGVRRHRRLRAPPAPPTPDAGAPVSALRAPP